MICQNAFDESAPSGTKDSVPSYAHTLETYLQLKQSYLAFYELQRQNLEIEIGLLATKIAETTQSIQRIRNSQKPSFTNRGSKMTFEVVNGSCQIDDKLCSRTRKKCKSTNRLCKRSFTESEAAFQNDSDHDPDFYPEHTENCIDSQADSGSQQPRTLLELHADSRPDSQMRTAAPRIIHIDLSGRDYVNFINLLTALNTLFQNSPLTLSQLHALNRSERSILKSFLVRKRLLRKSAPCPTDTGFYNRQALFKSRKRKEEQLKFVLGMCFGFLRDQFARANPVRNQSPVLSGRSPTELKQTAFFDSYFGAVARSENLHLSVFYLPAARRKHPKHDRRLRTINKVYVNLLQRSQSFMADFESLLRGAYIGLDGTVCGVTDIWRGRLADKLKNKITGWNRIIGEVGWSEGVARVCADIEANKRYVMPWSLRDVTQAIAQVSRVFFE